MHPPGLDRERLALHWRLYGDRSSSTFTFCPIPGSSLSMNQDQGLDWKGSYLLSQFHREALRPPHPNRTGERERHLKDFRVFLSQSWRPHLSALLGFSCVSGVLGGLQRYLRWPGKGAKEKHKQLVFSYLLMNLYYIHYSDNKQKIKTKQIQTKIPSSTIINPKHPNINNYFSLKNNVPGVGLNIYKCYVSNPPRSLRGSTILLLLYFAILTVLTAICLYFTEESPKSTQPVVGRIRVWTQVCLAPSPVMLATLVHGWDSLNSVLLPLLMLASSTQLLPAP